MKHPTDTEILERMTDDGRRGQLNRRDFIRYAIATGMSLSAASAVWSSSVSAATTPKKGGKFRIGSHDGNTADIHDPGTYLSFTMILMAHTYCASSP